MQVFLDLGILSIAYWLAFLFRFEFNIPFAWAHSAVMAWPYVLGLSYVALVAFRVPSFSWRYVSMRETLRIAVAVMCASASMVLVRLGLAGTGGVAGQLALPLGVLAMYSVLGFVALVGIRATRRLLGEQHDRRQRDAGEIKHKVLLIGAGQAGVMVARELAARPDLGLQAVGFIDDDKAKLGMQISGLTVLGSTAQLEEIATRKRCKRALITIANAGGAEIRRITLHCKELGLDTKIIPGIYELVGERVNLSRIRDVAIEDLLGRDPVKLDEAAIGGAVRGRVVVVTGAGGSIGSELCRQLCRYAPERLILVERFENALFEIHRELTAAYPEVRLDPRIADITDTTRMSALFTEVAPHTIFHAAAHKHVPMMEANPGEAIKNNVGGTRALADLAVAHQVARVVMISTDKAVNPTSVMGVTKRVAEMYVQALDGSGRRDGGTRFATVRFGNVLGSNGSVIPIFKEQIARGGPVTVTHPDMQRYFMTIPEASQLVLQAGAMGEGGEIFILDMGKPVRIVDLAKDLITLSGFRPGEDIDIAFSGTRPGEKLFEELATDGENAEKTQHPKIFTGRVRPNDIGQVRAAIDELLALADHADGQTLRQHLCALVPEYTPEALAGMTRAEPPATDASRSSERRAAVDVSSRQTPSGPIPAIS